MKNGFKPVVGHRFNLRRLGRCRLSGPGSRAEQNAVLHGGVPMVAGVSSLGPSTLRATGTQLSMQQSGFRPDQQQTCQGAKGRWQRFFAHLEQVMARIDRSRPIRLTPKNTTSKVKWERV
jgi:hypothetical protein